MEEDYRLSSPGPAQTETSDGGLVKRFEHGIKSCLDQLSAYHREIEDRCKKMDDGHRNKQKNGGRKDKNITFTLSYGDQGAGGSNHDNGTANGGPAPDQGRFHNKSSGNKTS